MGLTPNFDPAANCQLYSRSNAEKKLKWLQEVNFKIYGCVCEINNKVSNPMAFILIHLTP